LEQINDHFPKIVLSMDPLFGQSAKGVQWRNVIEWLIQEE
jgi:hypothetical protein